MRRKTIGLAQMCGIASSVILVTFLGLTAFGYLTSSLEKVGLTYNFEVIYCLSYHLLVEVFSVFWQIIFVIAPSRSHFDSSSVCFDWHSTWFYAKKDALQSKHPGKLNMMVIKHFHKDWKISVLWIFLWRIDLDWMKDNRAWSWRKTLGRE